MAVMLEDALVGEPLEPDSGPAVLPEGAGAAVTLVVAVVGIGTGTIAVTLELWDDAELYGTGAGAVAEEAGAPVAVLDCELSEPKVSP